MHFDLVSFVLLLLLHAVFLPSAGTISERGSVKVLSDPCLSLLTA